MQNSQKCSGPSFSHVALDLLLFSFIWFQIPEYILLLKWWEKTSNLYLLTWALHTCDKIVIKFFMLFAKHQLVKKLARLISNENNP